MLEGDRFATARAVLFKGCSACTITNQMAIAKNGIRINIGCTMFIAEETAKRSRTSMGCAT